MSENDLTNQQFDQKVRNVVISQVQLLIAIVVFILPIIGFFFKIQLDVALIKQNHEAHIEQSISEIEKLNKQQVVILQKLEEDHDNIIILKQQHQLFSEHLNGK